MKVSIGIVFGLPVLFDGEDDAQSWLSWLMSQPAGRWAVVGTGIAVIGVGVAHLVRGYQKKYDRFLCIPPDKRPLDRPSLSRWSLCAWHRLFHHWLFPDSGRLECEPG